MFNMFVPSARRVAHMSIYNIAMHFPGASGQMSFVACDFQFRSIILDKPFGLYKSLKIQPNIEH